VVTFKYAVHGGYVTSQTDGDRHWVPAPRLARLYELETSEYFCWRDDAPGRRWEDYIHLFPRYDGKYGRPDA
jgi:hypothetical protein